MRWNTKCLVGASVLFFPALATAQHLGQIACARQDNYTYLYSSMTTMDVIRTLQCGEQVEVTGRYQGFFAVRTSSGDTGYVGEGTLVLLKDKPGSKAPLPTTPQTTRPRTAYDKPPAAPAATNPIPAGFDLTLANNTPIRLRLSKTLSSETAHVGDMVELVVAEDVVVDGLCLIPGGGNAVGEVTEAEPKRHLGKGGRLGLNVKYVRLADNERAPARSYQEATGSNSTAGPILPLAHGKDVVFTQGTEITAYVDGDMYLKRTSFQPAKNASAATNPAPPR